MNQVLEHPSPKTKGIIYNPHFWAIIIIMATLATFYNANHIDIASWFPWLERGFTTEFIHDLHRSFFLIPLLYAGAIFRLRGAIFSWLVFLAAILPRALYFSPNPDALARTSIFALIALLACVLIAQKQNRRQCEKETFSKLEDIRQTYLSQILKAQESERQRIAQELHDDTIQTLLVIANHSQSLADGDYGNLTQNTRREAEKIKDMVLHITENIRRLSHDLRPSILDNMGLLLALRWLAEQLSKESNIKTSVELNGEEQKLNPEVEVIMFRIIQEAINNIRRHSNATEAKICIDFTPESLKIRIQDNGRGFYLPEVISEFSKEGKLGLNGMHQRAKLIAADFSIQAKPGEGTTIIVEAKV